MPGPNIPKILMAGGAVGFSYYLVMRQYWFPNPYKTQGIQNVEDRFTAAGGAGSHTPGVATKLGDADTTSRQDGGSKGAGTKSFQEKVGDQTNW
ncbi:hypothetical protein BU24DRAFT_462071 [Aaosphaeria arxii CBS 175.79]|uniref:Uncharacterized protein n=1 Tax=Aaosphaeria arxii CBS 175.79 TaxID=1450172 RepID=A0A6A5XSX3_9PLEO|nr:uncharacterized protein BU24DRAFT_462071 [Aaosphaeria arxii CBS 175.79]KAF2015851.1 hypothetical protein BU24DRAFT_462071 [Aaosphaeria arxii CBS 175.79]